MMMTLCIKSTSVLLLTIVINLYSIIHSLQYTDPAGIRQCTRNGLIALTFDDGPFLETNRLLDILKQNGIKATFFIVGRQLESDLRLKDILKNTFLNGHEIGSHTYSHPHLTRLNKIDLKNELDKTNDLVISTLFNNQNNSKRLRYMRIPYFESNQDTLNAIRELGYEVIFHSIETDDTKLIPHSNMNNKQSDLESAAIVNNVERVLNNSNYLTNSFIITQHDRLSHSIDSVEQIIKLALKYKYKLVSMSECLGLDSMFLDLNSNNKPAETSLPINIRNSSNINAAHNLVRTNNTGLNRVKNNTTDTMNVNESSSATTINRTQTSLLGLVLLGVLIIFK